MFITGPKVIEQVTGEKVTPEDLGGAMSHARFSGVTHFVAQTEDEAFAICKRLLSFLPSNNTDDPPFLSELHEDVVGPNDMLNSIVPDNPREAYDMHQVITGVVDRGDFLEVQRDFAPNLLIGFGRIEGSTVGVIANNPNHKAGVLDIDSSCKGARFIRFCNAFNIPLLTFVDVPGFLPGVQQEYGGIIRHGAKMLFAYGAATVPKITVVTRKAYGGAYLAMCGKSMGADRVAAWPSGEIAVMGAEGAVNVLYRKDIEEAENPDEMRRQKIQDYTETFANPYIAAGRGMIDDVIEPAETRLYVAQALEVLRAKREMRPRRSTAASRCSARGRPMLPRFRNVLSALFLAACAVAPLMAREAPPVREAVTAVDEAGRHANRAFAPLRRDVPADRATWSAGRSLRGGGRDGRRGAERSHRRARRSDDLEVTRGEFRRAPGPGSTAWSPPRERWRAVPGARVCPTRKEARVRGRPAGAAGQASGRPHRGRRRRGGLRRGRDRGGRAPLAEPLAGRHPRGLLRAHPDLARGGASASSTTAGSNARKRDEAAALEREPTIDTTTAAAHLGGLRDGDHGPVPRAPHPAPALATHQAHALVGAGPAHPAGIPFGRVASLTGETT